MYSGTKRVKEKSELDLNGVNCAQQLRTKQLLICIAWTYLHIPKYS